MDETEVVFFVVVVVSEHSNRITEDLFEILFHSSKQIQHFNRLELCFVKNWWCEVIKKFYDLVRQ